MEILNCTKIIKMEHLQMLLKSHFLKGLMIGGMEEQLVVMVLVAELTVSVVM